MSKPLINLTEEKATDYKCPKCSTNLIEHAMHIKQEKMLSMYCNNKLCPIVRIKIFTVG